MTDTNGGGRPEQQVGRAQSEHRKKGGQGHKKPLEVNSSAGVSRPGLRGEIALQADISEHKAQQPIHVARHTPESLPGVISGKVKLKGTAEQASGDHRPPLRR
jgi:hypothetical protein